MNETTTLYVHFSAIPHDKQVSIGFEKAVNPIEDYSIKIQSLETNQDSTSNLKKFVKVTRTLASLLSDIDLLQFKAAHKLEKDWVEQNSESNKSIVTSLKHHPSMYENHIPVERSRPYPISESGQNTLSMIIYELDIRTIKLRNQYNPLSRFLLTLFDQTPRIIYNPSNPNTTPITELNSEYKRLKLPILASFIDRYIPNNLVAEQSTCISLKLRLFCLLRAGKALIFAVVSPIFALIRLPSYMRNPDFVKMNIAWILLDAICTVVVTPLLFLALTIKMLAGFILTPTIVYHSRTPLPADLILGEDTRETGLASQEERLLAQSQLQIQSQTDYQREGVTNREPSEGSQSSTNMGPEEQPEGQPSGRPPRLSVPQTPAFRQGEPSPVSKISLSEISREREGSRPSDLPTPIQRTPEGLPTLPQEENTLPGHYYNRA